MSSGRGRTERRFANATLRQGGAWALALLVAVALWLSVNLGERASERTVRLRIDLVNLPMGKIITNTVPAYAQLRLRGSGLLLSSIDTDRMATQLDLAGVRTGRVTYSLVASDLSLPRNVDVTRVTPSRISLDIDVVDRRTVPIELLTTGELRAGLEFVEAVLLPAEVELEGPKGQLAGITQVSTQRVDLNGMDAGVNELMGRLQNPPGLVELRSRDVVVQLVIDRQLAQRSFPDVPIAIRNARAPWLVDPDNVAIEVRGPAAEIESLELNPSAITVDATDLPMPGPALLTPVVALPPGFDVVRIEPAQVTLRLEEETADTLRGPRPESEKMLTESTE
ncbi:MAG: CdaR family protein [Candidatus Binatia bacterium]|nr:CdaR family protein [Candidatus Binatia bacterium]MDG1960389.1 CdaR family protein [Candidatus Binatia bacterium]MDG2008256.1 CdaR family protein [Candidatus Binatia bacterium]